MTRTAAAYYIIAFRPAQPNQVKNIFELATGRVSEVLEKPGSFRDAGWDLQTLDQAQIANGEYLELNNGPRKRIRLYEDGTLVVRGAIDSWFLGWGKIDDDFEDNPRVHALAIIEFTAAAVHLYKRILPFLATKPEQVSFHVEISGGKVGDKFIYIVPFKVNTVGWTFSDNQSPLSKENPKFDGVVSADEIDKDPNRVGFEILQRLFLFFGVAANKIPYTNDADGVRRIDIAAIRAIR
jgi:hypothetical protein